MTVWSTDVKILAASSLLETDIYVYTNVGNIFKWHKFSKSTLQNGSVPQNNCAIYLNLTGGVHYDVVLDTVGVSSSDIPKPTKSHNVRQNRKVESLDRIEECSSKPLKKHK